jgi:outer membrane protein OmpA-like peptidoglycan-associated protein/Tol biopolymer transport system component
MKYRFILFLLLILHCSFFIDVMGQQQFSSSSKKAVRLFLDAADLYSARDYDKALTALNKAVADDPGFTEAYLLKGDIYADKQLVPDAIEAYRQAIQSNPDFSPNLYYILANHELSIGLYKQAKSDYLKFLDYKDIPQPKKEKAIANLYNCDFGINAINNPVPFDPLNLGKNINTVYDEYINAVTSDDQRIYFTRKLPKNEQTLNQANDFEEDFYYSVKKDSLWDTARNLGPPINTAGNEGAICISPDGQFLFFAACNRDDGYGSCDLYWSRKTGNQWSEPLNLGAVVNSQAWDSQPTFSSDGKTLYFASKRPGGKGSSDLWKTELLPGGEWMPPVNLGDSINTKDAEMAPFIHPDDLTLYFTSKGHPGMGGLDLFYSRKDKQGLWKNPVNLGYPINTYADEITIIVNATGDLAYISSDKLGGLGRQDVYSFKLYKEAQPLKVTYFKGIVFNKETKERLEAKFELIDLTSGKVVIESHSDPVNGEFLVALPTNKDYALNVSKTGYLFYSDHFALKGENSKSKPFIKNIPLQEIKIGETVVLKNIFFDTDKYELKPESRSELEKLISLLQTNGKISIEISGHTDNAGTPGYNLTLSKNRAKAVYDYLVEHGVSAGRLSYEGYGLSKPIDTNETEQGRANNRRTEFMVLGIM